MKRALILASIIYFVTAGCDTMSTSRFVQIRTSRAELDSTGSDGLTAAVAVDTFRSVADQLGLDVTGPIRVTSTQFEYTAAGHGKPVAKVPSVTLWVDDKKISFVIHIYGTADDLAAAERNVAVLFQEGLDKRGVRYEVETRAAWILRP